MNVFMKNRYLLFFIIIVLFILLPSFISNYPFIKLIIVSGLLSVLLFQSVVVIFRLKGYKIFAIIFGSLTLLIYWFVFIYPYEIKLLLAAADLLFFLFFIFITILLIKLLVKSKKVGKDTIMIACIIYFLFGIIGGFVFELCYYLIPGALDMPEDISVAVSDFIYFSFTTMTTIGYGDITVHQ